jgi:hypothetical protein
MNSLFEWHIRTLPQSNEYPMWLGFAFSVLLDLLFR